MEILKKASFGRPFEIENYDKLQVVELDTSLSKQYTLEQLVFYIKHSNISQSEYLEKCKNAQILPVSIIDTKNIIDAVNNFYVPNYHFSYSTVDLQKDFSFVLNFKEEKVKKDLNIIYNIVVSNSINSLVTTQNIMELITNKTLLKTSFEENLTSPEYIRCKLHNFYVRITYNADYFSQKDWENTLCIFVDGESWQFKRWKVGNLVSVFEKIPTFCVHKKNKMSKYISDYKVFSVIVDEQNNLQTNVDCLHEIMKRKQNIDKEQ